jgi:hypothetical protein
MYARLGKQPLHEILAALKARNPKLFAEVEPHVKVNGQGQGKQDSGHHSHDSDWQAKEVRASLPAALAKRLDDWLDVDHWEQVNAKIIEQTAKDGKRKADQKAALERLEQYAREQRLSRTQANVDAISAWLDANVRGYWSASAIDTAIRILSFQGRLQFEQPLTPPPPAPTPQWKKGDRLPDDATEQQLRSSTPEEIRAWMQRTRKGQT